MNGKIHGLIDGRINAKIDQLGSLLNRSWYGVEWDVTNSSPSVTRIASSVPDMTLHATLPIHSNMKGCLLADNGTVNYYLKADDWTKKADGTASALDGSDGQVMVEIPAYYRKFETDGNTRRVKISQYPLTDFEAVPKMYISAYEAALDRTNSKLASLINTTTQYRGGNNTSAWDAAANTLLGKPATNISRTNYRIYARNRGANWQMYFYEAHKTLFWFFIVEYATRNSQAAVNATLTAQGYKQGGLGNGVSTANSTQWNGFNAYNPFVPCGATNSLANGSGEVDYTAVDFGGAGVNVAFKANRYRGVEMPFGHIWKNTDGINIEIQANDAGAESRVWLSKNPAHWNDANYTNFENKGLIPRTNGYMSRALFGAGGEFVPSVASGGSTTYYSDYFYTSLPASGAALRTLLLGGAAHEGAYGGFGFSNTYNSPADTYTYFGSRLCFLPA